MTTILECNTEDGVRRCDARCHDAKGEDCSCICEGVNHGVGLEQARTNLRELPSEAFADELTWFEPQTEPMFLPKSFDAESELVYSKNQS